MTITEKMYVNVRNLIRTEPINQWKLGKEVTNVSYRAQTGKTAMMWIKQIQGWERNSKRSKCI